MGVGRTAENLPRRRIDVEQDGIVIGFGSFPSRAEHAAQCGNVFDSAPFAAFVRLFHVQRSAGLGDDPEGTQGSPLRKVVLNPLPVFDAFLNDPISSLRCIFIEVYPHPPLLVAMLYHNGRCGEIRRDGNVPLFPNFEKRPFIFHLIPLRRRQRPLLHIEIRMKPGNPAIQPPITKPIIRRQQSHFVLLRNRMPLPRKRQQPLHPFVNARRETDGGISDAYESQRREAIPDEVGEGDARAGNGHVGEIVEDVAAVRGFAVVGFVVEVEGRGEGVEVHAGVAVEDGGGCIGGWGVLMRAEIGGNGGRGIGGGEVGGMAARTEEVVEEASVEGQGGVG
mmetsp:Transcript_4072/g.8725  ORF Transcript_4072/g.8725 Transcript_4072/m.8725 type:complete len:336 (+) Transcript_4072:688-1695(+)